MLRSKSSFFYNKTKFSDELMHISIYKFKNEYFFFMALTLQILLLSNLESSKTF